MDNDNCFPWLLADNIELKIVSECAKTSLLTVFEAFKD